MEKNNTGMHCELLLKLYKSKYFEIMHLACLKPYRNKLWPFYT